MSPQFSAAVDPIILKVVALMERIDRSAVTSPQSERQSLETLFREAEAQVTDAQAWSLAKYALASWIDDLLITTPWAGHDWWESNSLEFALFKTRDRATQFFQRAKEAADLPRRDALEVFYLCVIMGFRGLYKLAEAELIAGQLNLPINLSHWTKNTAAAIQLRQGRPPIRESPQSPAGAPPLESRYVVVSASIVTVILTMLIATLWFVNNLLQSPRI